MLLLELLTELAVMLLFELVESYFVVQAGWVARNEFAMLLVQPPEEMYRAMIVVVGFHIEDVHLAEGSAELVLCGKARTSCN